MVPYVVFAILSSRVCYKELSQETRFRGKCHGNCKPTNQNKIVGGRVGGGEALGVDYVHYETVITEAPQPGNRVLEQLRSGSVHVLHGWCE